MRKFFDMLYFGGYYVDILHCKLFYLLIEPPLEKFILSLGHFSFIRRQAEKQGKTYEQLMKESFEFTKKLNEKDSVGFGHFWTGWLFFPMACGFWIDLAIIPFLIFERNVLPYPFKGVNLIYFAAAFGILSFILIFHDERCQRVVKEYRKKPQKAQRKAFYLFIGMYILVATPIILFFFYAKRVGGW